LASSPVQAPGLSSGIVRSISFRRLSSDFSPASSSSCLPITPLPSAPWQLAHMLA
jgi:hypothetical protein